MIPAGYMYKNVANRPDWIKAESVQDVYSLSGCCISFYFDDDYISHWKHNGYWLFDTPAVMRAIAAENQLDLGGAKLFYYEVFELEYCEEKKAWEPFEPEKSFHTAVERPQDAHLEGYDVVTFFVRTSPETSPLSCCALAEKISVNRHCLFDTFEQAKQALEAGEFDDSEPGPFRIFAVYSVAG
jgi:hypothetical protein